MSNERKFIAKKLPATALALKTCLDQNFINMRNVNLGKCSLYMIGLIAFIFCSCRKPNHHSEILAKEFVETSRTIVTNELYQEKTIEASKAMQQMMKENRLPGLAIGEHGAITSEYYTAINSNEIVRVIYPLLQTFRLVKFGETSTNNYTFERLSKETPWQLKRAWETDSNGKVVNEWPMP